MAVRLIDAHSLTWEEAGMLLSAAGDLRDLLVLWRAGGHRPTRVS